MIDALGKIGDPRAVKPLSALLHDHDWRVRWEAVKALEKLGRVAREPLEEALRDSNDVVRNAAEKALHNVERRE